MILIWHKEKLPGADKMDIFQYNNLKNFLQNIILENAPSL